MNNAQILRDRLWPHSQIKNAQALAARISQTPAYTPKP